MIGINFQSMKFIFLSFENSYKSYAEIAKNYGKKLLKNILHYH